jgi:hypothetical protein
VSRSQKWFIRPALFAFVVGAFIPLFWGVMVFLLFSVPEGWFSRFFWHAVYITCPFWVIEGEKALVLMPMLNGNVEDLPPVYSSQSQFTLDRSSGTTRNISLENALSGS